MVFRLIAIVVVCVCLCVFACRCLGLLVGCFVCCMCLFCFIVARVRPFFRSVLGFVFAFGCSFAAVVVYLCLYVVAMCCLCLFCLTHTSIQRLVVRVCLLIVLCVHVCS